MLSYATSHWHSLYGTCKQSAHERGTVTTILPYLYLSDYKAALSTETFNRLKITHVISVIEHRPSYPVDPKQSLHVPIADKVDVDVLAWLDTTTEFIRHALEDRGQTAENGNRVLVHCFAGISRSPTIICAYLLAIRHTGCLTVSDAIDYVRAKRNIVGPNLGFRKQLEEYAERLVAERKSRQMDKEKGTVQSRLNARLIVRRMLKYGR